MRWRVPVPLLLLLLLLLACLLDILRYHVLALYIPVVSGFFHLDLHCQELQLRVKPRVEVSIDSGAAAEALAGLG
jgi:hypothetical protein